MRGNHERGKLIIGSCVSLLVPLRALFPHHDEPPLAGPYAIDLLNPHAWGGGHEENNEKVNEITLEVTRVVLAIGVFAIGVELPKVSPRSSVPYPRWMAFS